MYGVADAGYGSEISRTDFVAWWARTAAKPDGDLKNFTTDLGGWAGAAGRRQWVKDRFGGAATEALTSPRLRPPPPGPWESVSESFGLVVDGLARVTCTLRSQVVAAAPKKLTSGVNSQIRECARAVGTEMRKLLTSPDSEFGDVLRDEDAAVSFLAQAAANVDALRPAAMAAFVLKVKEYLQKNRAALLDRDRVVLENWVTEMTAHWGDPGDPGREPTDIERVDVEALLVEELSRHRDWFFDERSIRPELIGEAWRRARRTLLKWKVAGRDVTHAGILHTTVQSLEIERWRERVRTDISLDADPALEQQLPPSAYTPDPFALRTVFAAAAAWLDSYPEFPAGPARSWELRTTQAILRAASAAVEQMPDSGFSNSDLRALVVRLWERDTPADARSATPDQAAGYVVMLARMALARHLDAVEDFELAGAPDDGQRNIDRYAHINELLEDNRVAAAAANKETRQ